MRRRKGGEGEENGVEKIETWAARHGVKHAEANGVEREKGEKKE